MGDEFVQVGKKRLSKGTDRQGALTRTIELNCIWNVDLQRRAAAPWHNCVDVAMYDMTQTPKTTDILCIDAP